MLYFVVILSLLSVAYAAGDERSKIHLTPLVLEAITEAAAECIKETEVKKEISDNFFNLKYENNAEYKKFMFCVCHKMNYADEDGHINDAVITLFEGKDCKDDVQQVIDNCNNIKEKDKLETWFQTFMCIYKDTPVLLIP